MNSDESAHVAIAVFIILTCFFVFVLILNIHSSETHSVLIDRGLMQHNPKTGEVEWVEDKPEGEPIE